MNYSLNPNLNKRLKSRPIRDVRKEVIKEMKNSLSMLDGDRKRVGFFGQKKSEKLH